MSDTPWNSAVPLGLEVVTLGHPTLRQTASDVPEEAFENPDFLEFLHQMVHTLNTERGVGLAAPQVGVSSRIFITRLPDGIEHRYRMCSPDPLRVWINPTFEVEDAAKLGGIEGCLSIPLYVGHVLRPTRIAVKALDQTGQPFSVTLEGWNARVFLHEFDHLDGVLYIDRLVTNEAGHPELYAREMWEEAEMERRTANDHAWLEARGLRVDLDEDEGEDAS